MHLSHIKIQCLEKPQDLINFQATWNELHKNCTAPSIYNGYDFIFESINVFFSHDVKLKIYILSDINSNQILAIYPLQRITTLWYFLKINTYEYTALDEIDKPYPLIRQGHLKSCWNAFLQHLKQNVPDCHHLQLIEIPQTYPEIELLPKICEEQDFIYRINPDKQGPIINLDGEWNDYWAQHKKMRKKQHAILNKFKDRITFIIHNKDWEWCLEQYIKLEQKSWKNGKVGLSTNAQTIMFYQHLFKRLHQSNRLYFGFLVIDNNLISAEIAYTLNDKVYFCHGCYDQSYKKHSPGMVSTSLFIKHFYGKNFKFGDFLCGYAGYLNNWANIIIKTDTIEIYNKGIKMRIIFGLRILKKATIIPMRKLAKKIYK